MKLSYSSIKTYETCPAKYRFEYEERRPTSSSPAMAFGDSLHRALHRFHDRPVPMAPSLGDLWEFLDEEWVSEGFRDESEERLYRDHARQVLEAYHRDNADSFRIPAALEYRFRVQVEGVELAGIIDRLDRLPGGGYEVIDYKTNRRLPPRSSVDTDLQLSLYYLAAREIWGIEPERLTLYFLLPGHRMTTSRSPADMDALRRRVITVAERIGAGLFEPRENPLCNWCDFQPVCPVFRHRYERQDAPRIAEIVDEWISLKREDRDRWRRMEELARTIKAYAEEHGFKRLFGSDGAIHLVERLETAPDPEAVRSLLEPLGLYDSVLAVDPKRLHDLIQSRTLPPAVEEELLCSREDLRRTTALYLREPARARR
jgi:putative RecB family exonuclease